MQRILIILVIVVLITGRGFAGENTFTVVSEPFPPYVDKDLKNNGWAWEVTKIALESQGYKTKLDIKPWARAKMEAIAGQYDALFPAYWTKERHQWFVFSMPIAEVRTGFWKRKDRRDIVFNGDLITMKDYTIGVSRGYATSEDFDKADYLNKYFTTDSSQGMKMLYEGRLDLVAGNELPILHRLRVRLENDYKGISTGMEFMEPILQVNYIHLAISKKTHDYLRKLEDFNIGMRQILLDGTYKKIQKKHRYVDVSDN